MVSPRLRPILAAAILALFLIPLIPLAPASGAAPLVADAGDSKTGPVGASLEMRGSAKGGTAPYTYAWSFLGTSAKFSAPTATLTRFDTTGLLPGVHNLTLTVTDALGATATDTVAIGVNPAGSQKFTGSILAGVPVDSAATTGLDRRSHTFNVPAGTPGFTATLDWLDADFGDFDLHLFDPNGQMVGGESAAGTSKPERLTVTAPLAGTWTARVDAYVAVLDQYTLDIVILGTGSAVPDPGVYHGGGALVSRNYLFGATDVQTLKADHTSDVTRIEWDLNGDGLFPDAVGNPIVANFTPGGVYPIAARAYNAYGLRETGVTKVEVFTAAHARILRCNGGPQNAQFDMETSAFLPQCWGHIGHNTYYLGPQAWTIAHGLGRSTLLEQGFSPPKTINVNLTTNTVFETSLDGVTWTPLAVAYYRMSPTDPVARQIVSTPLGASQPFRFIRVHAPESTAEGLSGFLDASGIELALNPATVQGAPRFAGSATLTCEQDLMEDFIAAHPCTFGGYNRYDSPSALHTYFLQAGSTAVTSVSGNVTVGPWRHDDWVRFESDKEGVNMTLEGSEDGIAFLALHTFRAKFFEDTGFNVTFSHPTSLAFLRLRSDYSQLYGRSLSEPAYAAQRHLKGYMLDSRLTVEGLNLSTVLLN